MAPAPLHNLETDLMLVRASITDLVRRVSELERRRAVETLALSDLRSTLEEAISLCSQILKLTQLSLALEPHA